MAIRRAAGRGDAATDLRAYAHTEAPARVLTHTAVHWFLDDPLPRAEAVDLLMLSDDELRDYVRELQAETAGIARGAARGAHAAASLDRQRLNVRA